MKARILPRKSNSVWSLMAPFGVLERYPGEDRQAQVDGGDVKSIDGALEFDAEGLLRVKAPGDVDEGLGEIGMGAPVAPFVGVDQGASRDLAANAHIVELALLSAQASLDIAQAFSIGELHKRHA